MILVQFNETLFLFRQKSTGRPPERTPSAFLSAAPMGQNGQRLPANAFRRGAFWRECI